MSIDLRLEHLDLLKRALQLRTLSPRSREAFTDMLEEMTTEAPRRCAHAGPMWKLWALRPKQAKWVRTALGEEDPEPDMRFTSGDVPRGREVPTPEVLKNLPKLPPGRSR